MEGVCCGQGSATASRRLTAPLTLQYPGVQVIIVHPDTNPLCYRRSCVDGDQCSLPYGNAVVIEESIIVCEKVVGSAHDHIPLKKDWINQSFFSGADDEIRVFEPLAITGLQPVEKISAHSFHQKSHSFANQSLVF